jgi:hypothetical protein
MAISLLCSPESEFIFFKKKIKLLLIAVGNFSLAFSVTLFCTEAVIAIAILLIRRNKAIGGELGGPPLAKYVTATALIGLWLIYLIASSLEAYGVIKFGAKA